MKYFFDDKDRTIELMEEWAEEEGWTFHEEWEDEPCAVDSLSCKGGRYCPDYYGPPTRLQLMRWEKEKGN